MSAIMFHTTENINIRQTRERIGLSSTVELYFGQLSLYFYVYYKLANSSPRCGWRDFEVFNGPTSYFFDIHQGPEIRWACQQLKVVLLFLALFELWFDLADVKLLDCSDNQLTEIPASLSEMLALEQLYLRHNKLRLLPKLPAPALKVLTAK